MPTHVPWNLEVAIVVSSFFLQAATVSKRQAAIMGSAFLKPGVLVACCFIRLFYVAKIVYFDDCGRQPC